MFIALLAICLCLRYINNPNHGLWEGWREPLSSDGLLQLLQCTERAAVVLSHAA